METYSEKFANLCKLYTQYRELFDQKEALLNAVTQSPAFLDLAQRMQTLYGEIQDLEQRIRCEALAAYAIDHNPNREAVTIAAQDVHRLTYDREQARAWMIANAPEMLKGNYRRFETRALQEAEAGRGLDFVKITRHRVITAVIALDGLAAPALPKEGEVSP